MSESTSTDAPRVRFSIQGCSSAQSEARAKRCATSGSIHSSTTDHRLTGARCAQSTISVTLRVYSSDEKARESFAALIRSHDRERRAAGIPGIGG